MSTRMIGIGSITFCAALCGVLLAFAPSPAAAQAQPSCNHAPGTSLEEINGGFVCVDANGVVQQPAQAKGGQQASSKCGWNNFFLPQCIMVAIGSTISGLLISAAVIILTIVGTLFNWIVEYTIIFFSQNIFDLIRPAVRTGWTAFRDLGNIVIIGMFTYTALAMILGLQKFNAKAHVAKVLLIAILINFSFLFTSLIIDASNFAATQFYNSMGQVAQSSASLASVGTSDDGTVTTAAPLGISGLLMSYMGITGTLDGFRMTWELGRTNDWGALAFFNGIFVTTLFIGVALVLLYGCFLLVSRALLLIFLMLTSALAFASYLVPGLANSSYGWNAWWRSLIQSAVLAPLLMLFLWATLLIAREIAQASPGGTIGSLVVNPTGGGNIGALFNYVIILGLLFISFKVSSSFATSIGGFNWAAYLPLRGLGAAVRVGMQGAKVAAWGANRRWGESLSEAAKEAANKAANEGKRMSTRGQLANVADKLLKASQKSDFNALRGLERTPLVGDAIMKTAGFKKAEELTGKMRTLEEGVKQKTEAAKSEGERLAFTKEEREQITKEAAEAAIAGNEDLKTRHDSYSKEAKEGREQMAKLEKQREERDATLSKSIEGFKTEMERTRKAADNGPRDDVAAHDRAAEAERRHNDAVEERKRQLREQEEHIDKARKTISRAEKNLKQVETDAIARAKETGTLPESFASKEDIAAMRAYDRPSNALTRTYHRVAGVERAQGIKNDQIAGAVRKTIKKEGKQDKIKNIIADMDEKADKKSEEKPEPPGPAPGTPASTT